MNEPREITIKTSATALYNILSKVRKLDEVPLNEAWAEVLEAHWSTADFASKHAEVMNLWSDVCNEVKGLELESLRKRMERYTPVWWFAIVAPDHPWSALGGDRFIGEPDLDMLATVGELIEARLGDSSFPASQQRSFDHLRDECAWWLEFVDTTEEINEESFRQALRTQISHLIWLIDNAHVFGIPRIVYEGDRLTGELIRSGAQHNDVQNNRRFRDRLTSFVAALTLVANLIHSSQTVFDAADHTLPAAERIIKELTSQSSDSAKSSQKGRDE